jgi:N-sulfoglucosamine sulfohydrolase
MIVKLPGQTKRGIACDARVTWADVTPTALALAGATPKPADAKPAKGQGKRPVIGSHGRSLLEIVEQEHPAGWDDIFLSHTFHEIQMYYPMRVLISGRYKYIYNIAHPLPFPFASDLYASRTWQAALKQGDGFMYGKRTVRNYSQRPRDELYDLTSDPDETRNLAADPAHQSTLAELQKRMQNWQKETRDPWVSKWTYE